MRYIKLFDNINWDFDDEEINSDIPPLKVGDIISFVNTEYWDPHHKKFKYSNVILVDKVTKIDKSENIDSDVFNYYKKGSILYDGWLFKTKNHWPWFKYNDRIEVLS